MTETDRNVTVRRHDEAGHVVELVLDRPQAHNALSTEMARDLTAATDELTQDGSVRAVVLSSSSEAFCVGADLKQRNSFSSADLLAQRPYFRAAFAGVRELPVPVIAAVHGFALGGGLELALSCDLIVCDETAVLGLPEVTVGVIPGGGGTQLLARRIGAGRAADLIFTGRRIGVDEAERLGLLDRRVPAGEDRAAALELAGTVAANSPVGVRNAKRALRGGAGVDLATGLEFEDGAWQATAFSADRVEGVAAWAEKRRPDWPGR
ncbi:MAG: enoyl-CoA hydratase/isomerase family protein [Sporichthyaceae bacterium]|nr:enoyl-CoA hydratase/isomerase family protein [Sporichthyaceae bacterium]